MAIALPAQGRGEKRFERFIESAAAVFAREGYERASIDAIRAEAGGSKATLYRYFDGKEDLFRAAVWRAMRRDGYVQAWFGAMPIETAAVVFAAAVAVRGDRELLRLIELAADALDRDFEGEVSK